VKTVTADGQRRVVLRSLRDLRPGEELTYNYRLNADPDHMIRCTCGSKNCAGWL
jgi:SET domain-containing protein